MRGKCLCGDVEFEVLAESLGVYQCHCSLCRKQGGSASNSATIVAKNEFRWIAGEEKIGRWRKATGFRSDFCSSCGSPVPNTLDDSDFVWIPVGLIEETLNLIVVAHLHTASMAAWDPSQLTVARFETAPKLEELVAILKANRDA